MEDILISELPLFVDRTGGIYVVINNSGETETFKVARELLIGGGNINPSEDNTFTLGNESFRWKSISIGPGTLFITDQTLGTLAGLTVNNGVLLIDGANQLQVGELKFVNNTIESTSGSTDIEIGVTGATADLVLNRNTVLASGKTLTLPSGSASKPPLILTSGTNLTSATAGAIEYDGKLLYATPIVNQRGLLETKQIYINRDRKLLQNSSGQQSLLDLTNGVAVTYATRYKFKIIATVRTVADNVNLFFAIGGDTSDMYYRCNYRAIVGKSSYGPAIMATTIVEVTGSADNQVKNTINISQGGVGGTYFDIIIEGTVDTKYSGNLKPIVLCSPIPGYPNSYVDNGAYMEIYPIGPADVSDTNTSIGTWS